MASHRAVRRNENRPVSHLSCLRCFSIGEFRRTKERGRSGSKTCGPQKALAIIWPTACPQAAGRVHHSVIGRRLLVTIAANALICALFATKRRQRGDPFVGGAPPLPGVNGLQRPILALCLEISGAFVLPRPFACYASQAHNGYRSVSRHLVLYSAPAGAERR